MTKSTDHANPHIQKIAVLQRKPSRDDALSLLREVARRTSYLMKENRFRVGMLTEFFPRNRQLLGMNVNGGAKILLRLRNPHDEFRFLPMESILSTMIHELTHNLYGPHDNKFYAKFDDLMSRQWVIDQRGLYDAFLGQGRRLGGAMRHRISPRGRRSSSRGRKLGGSKSVLRGSPREMAALAAHRRARDNASCGDTNKSDFEEEIIVIDEGEDNEKNDKLESESKIEVIDLT